MANGELAVDENTPIRVSGLPYFIELPRLIEKYSPE